MRRWCHALSIAILLAPLPPALAQDGGARPSAPAPDAVPGIELERQIFLAFQKAEYTQALELIERFLATSPNNVDMLYNAACAGSRLGRRDEAAAYLLRAVKAGFVGFASMKRDSDLEAIRDHPIYLAILEAAERSGDRSGHDAQRQWRATYGTSDYRYETDERHRLDFATALDEVSHREMRAMLEAQAEHMIRALFQEAPPYYVLIAVPLPEHAHRIFNGDFVVGGIYQHSLRRLVARDIGGALRHEFFHALHYGHMERLGQEHPIWLQEGLAALYEDYELDGKGGIRFLPNHRQEIVKRRARAGRLLRWNVLFGLDGSRFMDQAGHLYPQVRSIFQFLAERGVLEEWYAAYVRGFADDPSGKLAFERLFGKELEEVESEWRRWIIALPELDTDIDYGDAALGIETSLRGSNDGVRVDSVQRGSSAASAGIRRGDVIVAIDDRATRSLMELRQVIASREVGERVAVRLRRDGDYLTVDVTLRPLAPVHHRWP